MVDVCVARIMPRATCSAASSLMSQENLQPVCVLDPPNSAHGCVCSANTPMTRNKQCVNSDTRSCVHPPQGGFFTWERPTAVPPLPTTNCDCEASCDAFCDAAQDAENIGAICSVLCIPGRSRITLGNVEDADHEAQQEAPRKAAQDAENISAICSVLGTLQSWIISA